MVIHGVLRGSLKLILILAFCFLSIYLSSCSQTSQLPKDAQAALNAYWQSLPSASEVEYHIIRAWPGDISAEELSPLAPEMEMWCVETELTSSEDINLDGERMIWIIVRENEKASWTAALLATMSSIWPYEACQIRP